MRAWRSSVLSAVHGLAGCCARSWRRGARCALEHGGAAPVVLAEPYDTDKALPAIAKGGFYHAGQVCVSVQRVFVPARKAKGFAKALAKIADKLVVGAPEDPATEVGPLIRPAEVDRVAEWVDEAVAAGAKLLCGGRKISDTCYAPTVLLNPPADAKVSTLEIFGPVVCVYGYESLDAAVEQANALPVAFQAAVFTENVDTASRLYEQLDGSAVMINDHSAFRDDVMPFAGLRESGSRRRRHSLHDGRHADRQDDGHQVSITLVLPVII